MMNNTRIIFITGALVATVVSSCSSNAPAGEKPVVQVRVDTVVKTDAAARFEYVGIIEENTSVSAGFPSLGTIEGIFVSEGDFVRKGQLLAKLDQSSAQSMLDAADATLKQARDAYSRLKSIHDKGSLPEIQMVDVETKLQQAESSFNIARKNLENCILYSPATGIIGKRMAEPGEFSVAGKGILTILDISSVRVSFSVPEKEISLIPRDCRSEITVNAPGNLKFTGNRITKSIVAGSISHAYPVHILLSNPGNLMLPGMVCRVELFPGTRFRDIVVPAGVIQTASNGSKFVWCSRNGVAKRTIVTTGEARGNGVVITTGLEEGDLIVTHGYQKISDNDKIAVR